MVASVPVIIFARSYFWEFSAPGAKRAVNLLRRIPKRDLSRMYGEHFLASEVKLLPYYIAALNVERAHFEITGT